MTPLELALRYLTTDFATIAKLMSLIPYPKPAFSQLYEALRTLESRGLVVYRQGRPTGIERHRAESWKLNSAGVLAQQEQELAQET